MPWLIRSLALAGFIASVYAFKVRINVLKSPDYAPVCDINDHISCSKAFGSDYSQTLGVPNPLTGMLYYMGIIILSFVTPLSIYLFYFTLPALVFSIYLAYISFVKQRNFCLVCSFSYIVNILLTWLCWRLTG